MLLSGDTHINEVMEQIPDSLDYFVGLNPHDFARLHNPILRRCMAGRISLRRLASMCRVDVNQLLEDLACLGGRGVIQVRPAAEDDATLPASPTTPPPWMADLDEQRLEWVNVLPLDYAGLDPLPTISAALRRLRPGEVIALVHTREPRPLYDVLARGEWEWYARPMHDDEWHLFIRRRTAADLQ